MKVMRACSRLPEERKSIIKTGADINNIHDKNNENQ